MAEQIARIREQLDRGETPAPVKVRELLSWYDAQRRGQYVVMGIRQDLEENGIVTVPDFEGAWIDGRIRFYPELGDDEEVAVDEDRQAANELMVDDIDVWEARDPSHQVSKLASANQEVTTVQPNDTIARAITKMVMNDFSQLPVVAGERNLRGVVSWKTIGQHRARGGQGNEVREAMEDAHEVRPQTSIFDVMGLVAQHDYVIIRSADQTISGIVTATDLSEQFRNLSEPFLLLSEIENLLRNLINDKFDLKTLQEVGDRGDGREIRGLADMTFGEYIRLLENRERWLELGLELDRAYFCESLDFVRQIRNDVMHFDPDGIEPDQVRRLRETANAIRQLGR